ncbi:MAG: hypothetical protein K2K12_02545, partial [Clostridia bacterium]|nr:hypothetical protein [Clostridia bacterium]
HISIFEETRILDEDKKLNSVYDYIDEPYYIEENIVDLKRVLSLCEEMDWGNTPLRKRIDWDELCCFWELMLNIMKQREVGYPVTDIEYIYQKGVQLNLPIELKHASVELGFAQDDEECFVVVGESEIGKMQLYQEEDIEFVFVLEYDRKKIFSKEKVMDITHWHPRTVQMAMEDVIAFMKNDREYFRKQVGLRM